MLFFLFVKLYKGTEILCMFLQKLKVKVPIKSVIYKVKDSIIMLRCLEIVYVFVKLILKGAICELE